MLRDRQAASHTSASGIAGEFGDGGSGRYSRWWLSFRLRSSYRSHCSSTRSIVGLLVGFALGAGAAAAMVLFDSPPAHIERWRSGAEGEKATARKLRPLLDHGWTLLNDIETEHGNIDHVVVGPAGVFMLESKRLSGRVGVDAGKLIVRWHEDPADG
jgi:hypothetical protein